MPRFSEIKPFVSDGAWECDFTIDSVFDFLETESKAPGGIDLDPDFQRQHVWTEAQQIAWLEYLLRGGRTGRVLYFNSPSWKSYGAEGGMTLVDGKQRLEALRRFKANEIPIFGHYRREWTGFPRMHLGRIKVNVNTLQTRAEVIQWYIDMNAGGTPHTSDEIALAKRLLAEEIGI